MLKSDPLLRGTLDLLILHSLRGGQRHGYGVCQWLEAATGDELQILEGTLYPALHRLHKKAWIEAEWGSTANNRRAKYYRLTELGQRQLDEEASRWRRYVAMMDKALSTAAIPGEVPA